MPIDIILPDLGDGIESGDVLEVLVEVGQIIETEQGLVELETDKATVEVPADHGGTVTKVHVRVGETVKIGATLVTVEAAAIEPETPPQAPARSPTNEPTPAVEPSDAKPEVSDKSSVIQPQTEAQPPADPARVVGGSIPAGPAVRRFSREVGVDLARVQGTGPSGRITRDDVLAIVRQASQAARAKAKASGNESKDEWGTVRIERMPKIRRTIAAKMLESWTTAPRVTNFDDADVTELERIRQSSKADYAERGIKLTSMPFIIKSVALALQEHPLINAVIDQGNGQIIYKEYVNIGIAVDTQHGLVVPSLRGADALSIPEIAHNLAQLAETVRKGDFSVSDLRGGTFTISNLGAIGGTYSTPIINVPEVAILLVGRSRKMPVAVDDQVAIRLMMPLSLSYDHRLVDGATAARFLNEVIGYLEAPGRLLLAP